MSTAAEDAKIVLCLHSQPAGKIKTKNGIAWVCQQPSTCHFSCPDEQEYLYGGAVEEFLSTGQSRPLCCMGENYVRNYAKLKVVTDMEKESFARPFFVCSKKDDPCSYFEWGDQKIVETPLCKHQWPSRMLKVKKEGPNKGRSFFCCREREENRCKFFKWVDNNDEEEDPLMPGHIELFSMPPSYKYTLKKTGAMFTSHEKDRKKAYAEFVRSKRNEDAPDIHQAHIAFLRAEHPSLFGPNSDAYKKELLEKRISSKELDNKNEPVVLVKKRKTLVPYE